MKRSWKRTRIWRRLVSGLLTAVMLVTMLPTAAYAALLDNTPDQNRQILEELTAFWGDEKTAQEAMELLRQYGLIDEEGNILTDWSGKISIQEESRPLTIGQARAMSEGDVTVNGRACGLAELNAVLDGMERLGLLVDDVPVAHWQLQVNGQSVAPAELSAALEGWTAPEEIPEEIPEETPEEIPEETPNPTKDPNNPAAPDPSQETGPAQQPEQPEEPETPQGTGAGSPEQAGGVLASLGRFFGVGAPAVAPAAPVVTVLGQEADSGELLDLIAFLDQYGLLTKTGAASDWGLTLPGGERETDLTELLAMLESGDYDPNMVISVDGTPITMADFKTMMDIEAELQRIQDTYLNDEVDLTPEQAESLYSLYQQLAADGIQLYDTRAADELEFPSGVNQALRVQVPALLSFYGPGSIPLNCTLFNDKEGDEVDVKITLLGSTTGDQPEDVEGIFFVTGLTTTRTITLKYNEYPEVEIWSDFDERYNGERVYAVRFEAPGVIFQTSNRIHESANSITIPVYIPETDYFLDEDDVNELANWDFYEGYGGNNGGLGMGCEEITENGVTYVSIGGERWVDEDGNLRNSTWPRYMYDGHNEFWIKRSPDIHMREAVLDGTITHVYASWDTSRADKGNNNDFTVDSIATEYNDGLSTVELNFTNKENEKYEFTWDAKRNVEDKFKITDPVAFEDSLGSIEILKHTVQENNTGSMMVRSKGIKLTDERDPTVVSVTTPESKYYYNDRVPITVVFSEPVKSDGMKLTANGTELTSVSEGTGKTHTFLYEVPAAGNTFLDVTSIWGAEDVTGRTMGTDNRKWPVLKEGSLEAASLLAAVPMPTADNIQVGDLTYTPAQGDIPAKTTATVEVTLDLPEDERLRELILSGVYALDNGFACGQLAASMDGGETLIPLVLDDGTAPTKMTATVELDAGTLINKQNFVMEFYHITVEENDAGGVESITAGELFFGRYAAFSARKPIPLKAEGIVAIKPDDWPTDPVYLNSRPNPDSLKWKARVDARAATWEDIEWYSDNPAVADIDGAGQVTILSKGTANFYVRGFNGGLEAYRDEDPYSESGTYHKRVGSITVEEGAEPYLYIPEETMTIREGDPLTLRWASNLVQKNAEFGNNAPTTFTITVKDPDGNVAGETYSITYDPKDTSDPKLWIDGSPNQSYPITGLKTTTGDGKYTITISAQAAAGVPNAEPEGYSSETYVTVISQPVKVRLDRPENLFVVNSGTMTVGYTLEHFDAGNNAAFELVVTDNGTGETVVTETKPDSDGGGSFTIELEEAETKGFRTIYDVSLKAKNTAEPDWSRDSFTLYIYDKDCLDILVQPMENGRVVVSENGDTVTMSNEEWIASLKQNEIIALNRDIDLQTAISINYGDHAWGEASDRIRWASEQSGVAAVNYPQGAFYENIENLPYSSYAPATQFLLSGKDDGTTVVEAIHALAGGDLSSSVEVTVNTLKDKLYLFQFYPVASGMKMLYTNGDGQQQTAVSDSQGRFAIYEENGIASDIYVEANIDGEKYLGTVYNEDLVSQEKDAVSLELYPLNSMTLRKAASVPVYLKMPNGRPYTGTVQVRAGVYRNGEWLEGAVVDPLTNKDENGTVDDYSVSFDKDGHTFVYSVEDFQTEKQPEPITAADDILFVLELRAEGYYPILFEAYGSLNEADAVRLGQRVVTLEEVPDGQENKPFVGRQALYFSGAESGMATDVRSKTGRVGPSKTYDDLLLATTVLWWGDTDTTAKRSLEWVDETGWPLSGTQMAPEGKYPFCSMPVSHITVPLDKEQLDNLGVATMESRKLKLRYLKNDMRAKEETTTWQLFNATAIEDAVGSEDLLDKISSLGDMLGGMNANGVSAGNDFLTVGITMATQMGGISIPGVSMTLAPTSDPTRFRGLVTVGLNNIEGDNVSRVEADSGRGSDLDAAPGLEDLKGVYNKGLQGHLDDMGNGFTDAAERLDKDLKTPGAGISVDGDGNTMYALQGWFETEVYFDDDNTWKSRLLTGGFTAGGGYGYEWTWNLHVGPVPMILELGLGAAGTLSFTSALTKQYDELYLTELRLYAYLQAFAGIGFDYTVIAMKLGFFGRLGAEATLRWLNTANDTLEDNAQRLDVSGEVGIKAQVEVLFISYEKILWSQSIDVYKTQSNNWDSLEQTWQKAHEGMFDDEGLIGPPRNGALHADLLTADLNTGVGIYSADREARLPDRDYLDDYTRSYNSAGPVPAGQEEGGFSLFSLFSDRAAATNVVETLGNSYSQATPSITGDGEYLFYLRDMDEAVDATVIRTAVMTRNEEGGYNKGSVLNDDGYGDTGLKAAGSGDGVAAVWSRTMKSPAVTEPGQAITPDIQADLMNSSDIMVAVPGENGSWEVTNLTEDNNAADLSPVVARSGDTVFVAWRQVASSSAVDLTDFDARDYIYYRISIDGGKNWSNEAPIYNGTSGTVMGLEAAMLSDGTAAVAFTLQGEKHDMANGEYDQDVGYAVIGKSADDETYDVVRYAVMPDEELSENPQIAAVKLSDRDTQTLSATETVENAQEAFVLGWHSLSTDGESDIRLAAVGGDGNRITGFVDSLSALTESSGVDISADFQFVGNADNLDDLSVLWTETMGDKEKAAHDRITGIRFRTVMENGVPRVSTTAAQPLVEMDDYTAIDSFSTYVDSNTGYVYAVAQGTEYDYGNTEEVPVTYADGTSGTVTIAGEKTSIYTAAGAYTDTVRVDSILPDYGNIRKGAQVPIQISVTNLGTQPVDKLTVTFNDGQKGKDTSFGENDAFVPIAPGETRSLTVFYTVPADCVPDLTYTVTCTFGNGTAHSTEQEALLLNIPDLGIADTEILRRAEDGERVLQFTLINQSDAELADSGRVVKLDIFSDPQCTKPVSNEYFDKIELFSLFTDEKEPLLTVSGDDLEQIDNGSYTVQYSFDLESYIAQEIGGEKPYQDAHGEVRDGGVKLYAKTWIESSNPSQPGEFQEYITSNNSVGVTLESLLKQAEGEHVTITSQLSQADGSTNVDVTLQNNSIRESETGNVIVTLLDKDGNVVGQKQSYTGGETGKNGLVVLTPEQKVTLTSFTFDPSAFPEAQNAVSAEVTYSDLIQGADNADLASLTFSNIPGVTLGSFAEDSSAPGTYRYTVSTDDLTSTTVTAATASGLSTASVSSNGGEAQQGTNALSATVPLIPGKEDNTITVQVKADNGTTKTYILTVQNNDDPVITWPDGSGDATTNEYGTEVYYAGGDAVINLTAVASGDYKLSYQWHSCDANGGNAEPLENETASTLTVPSMTGAGTYYYRCKVIRHLVDGGTKDYWSSVATVQINPGTDNSVTLTGTTVTFDNQPHGLTSAEAAKAGSTLHYSTDGTTWSETTPTFTAVGAHTVWVYATNPNYQDTAVVTADVVIQEKAGTEFKLETERIEGAFGSYPDSIKETYGDAAGLEAALKTEVTKLGPSEDNTQVYDVKLLFSLDGGKP